MVVLGSSCHVNVQLLESLGLGRHCCDELSCREDVRLLLLDHAVVDVRGR